MHRKGLYVILKITRVFEVYGNILPEYLRTFLTTNRRNTVHQFVLIFFLFFFFIFNSRNFLRKLENSIARVYDSDDTVCVKSL